jgi:hypothetical protein
MGWEWVGNMGIAYGIKVFSDGAVRFLLGIGREFGGNGLGMGSF